MFFAPVAQSRTVDMVTLTPGDWLILLILFVMVMFFIMGRRSKR